MSEPPKERIRIKPRIAERVVPIEVTITPKRSKKIIAPKPIVSDITVFFQHSTRNENDSTNKTRERILSVLCSPPTEFLEHDEYGPSWRSVHQKWNDALRTIATNTTIPPYTSTTIQMKGGRGFNYDAEISYYHESILLATRKIEFKYGGTTIDSLPQFLSLQAKMNLFSKTYDTFWYESYLDQYLACDTEITQPKPSLDVYLKSVTSTIYSVTPFFEQLKERELFFQQEKNNIVNRSITDYLNTYGHTINIPSFSEKVVVTQADKIYLIWSNETFFIDQLHINEMSNITFHSIKNGNVLELKSGSTSYHLLLRWRNHKGILNPAWQISMKRV